MTFQYQTHLDSITHEACPCVNKCKQKNVEVIYRFTKHTADADDFVPTGVQKKQNFPNCESFALSFFRTPQEARDLSVRIRGGYKTILSKLGTHISRLSLNTTDGLCTKFNNNGHLDLHPYVNVTFHTRITDKEDVVPTNPGVINAP